MSYERYSPSGFGFLPPVVKNLIIINGLFFLAKLALENMMNIDLTDILGLHYFAAQKFAPYQFITYMFMHGSFSHIFFNMFALWMFGSVLEQVWGPKKFLLYYIVTGIGAALVHYMIFYFQFTPVINSIDAFILHPDLATLQQFASNHQFNISESAGEIGPAFENFKQSYNTLQMDPGNTQAMQESVNFITAYREHFLNIPVVIGASGAIYGLLLAFGMLFPNSLVYVYLFIPMKAKWFVVIFGAIELLSGFFDSGSNVAHFAHLGGMIFGFFLIIYWKKMEARKYRNHYGR
ncbi:MAG: rhomboid family intramembrane serine protease [Bacteroidota bacterium]